MPQLRKGCIAVALGACNERPIVKSGLRQIRLSLSFSWIERATLIWVRGVEVRLADWLTLSAWASDYA